MAKTIIVSRGTVATDKTEFEYGLIKVTSDPSGLVVSTNGVEIGKTPITIVELRPGRYALTITDGENDLSANVDVGPKEAAGHASQATGPTHLWPD